VLDLFSPTSFNPPESVNALGTAPLWLVALVDVLVATVEAALWTMLLIEISAAAIGRPLIGGVIGVLGYSIGFHYSSGFLAIIASAWIAVVLAAVYLLLRARSRVLAFIYIAALRWLFVAYAILLNRTP
jgi:hypothetical protein